MVAHRPGMWPRATLRSVVALLCLATSVTALFFHWDPWVRITELTEAWIPVTASPRPRPLSGDGELLITVGPASCVSVWQLSSGTKIATRELGSSAIVAASFIGDDRFFAASEDQSVHVWDSPQSKEERSFRIGPRAVFWPACELAVCMDAEGITSFQSLSNAQILKTFQAFEVSIFDVSPSRDGKRVVVSTRHGEVQIWNARTWVDPLTMRGHVGGVPVACFSPDGTQVASGGIDGTARLWDASNGKTLHVLSRDDGRISGASFAPDGKRVITHDDGCVGQIWDAATGEQLVSIEPRFDYFSPEGWLDAWFSLDGRRVFTTGGDDTIRIWDAQTGRRLASFRHNSTVGFAIFAPSSSRLVASSSPRRGSEASVTVWRRRRPEWWWGIFWLKEFWAAVLFGLLLIWSLWRDRKYFKSLAAKRAA